MKKKLNLTGARKKCDKILANIEKDILRHYKKAEFELTKKWEEYLNQANKEIEDKWQAFQEALRSGDKELIKKTGKEHQKAVKDKTVNNQHFKEMVDEVTTQMAHVNETALSYINGEVPRLYQISYNAVGKATSDVVMGYSFSLMDAQTTKNLLAGNKDYMKYFKQMDITKDKRWNKKLIHSQMTQGILQGESIPDLAKRLQNVTNMNKNQAVRNARTMTTSIENRGRQDGLEKVYEDGIVTEKEWIATGDHRTRQWHLDIDGQTVPHNKPFHNFEDIFFPGDPDASPKNVYNCRCAEGAVIIGFRNSDGTINRIESEKDLTMHTQQIEKERKRRKNLR